MKILLKILFTISILLLWFNNSYGQTTKYINPWFIGTSKVGSSGTIIFKDSSGYFWSNSSIWTSGSELKVNNTTIKDSSSYTVFNKTPVFTQTGWIKESYLADTSVSASKIKVGTIDVSKLTTTLRDSLFSSSTVAGVSAKLEALKTDYNVLFNDNGNFKPSVLQTALSYDSTLHQLSVLVDTSKGMRITGGKIVNDLAEIFDYQTNSFISELKVGNSTFKDSTNGSVTDSLNLRGSMVFVRNGQGIGWGGTFSNPTYGSLFHDKLQPRMTMKTDGDFWFEDIDQTWSIQLTGGGINISAGEYQIGGTSIFGLVNTYTARQNYTDTVDVTGAVLIGFVFDAITVNGQLTFGSDLDGTGSPPNTSIIGVPASNYFGSSDGTILGVPNAWMKVTLDGNEYRVPLYTAP